MKGNINKSKKSGLARRAFYLSEEARERDFEDYIKTLSCYKEAESSSGFSSRVFLEGFKDSVREVWVKVRPILEGDPSELQKLLD